jgi:hypothetical protein
MDDPDDWAVVFVHGIGDQFPGETLDRFGSPLAEYALAQHGPGSRLEGDDAEWVIHLVDDTQVRRWRLVEVHWADLVAPPTYPQLLRWLVLVAPWILHADALLWSQRRPRTPRHASIRWWLTIGLSLWSMRFLWAFTRGMVLLVAGALAQLVLTIVGLIGLVPALRGPALGLQRRLVGSVGDSFAYLYDAATWTRIERRLVDAVTGAGQHADRVAVVTHSQGTAVMHRALADGSMPDVVTAWMSLGSGLQKLTMLRQLTTKALVGWAGLRVAALTVFFGSIPFWEYVPNPVTGEDEPSQVVGVAFLVAMVALWAPYPTIRRLKRSVEQVVIAPLSGYSLRWLDLYSFHDPVPGGPMPGSNGPVPAWLPQSREVFNEGSFRRDHSAYVANVEQVVRPFHDLLAPPTLDPFVAAHITERRRRRVRALVPMRFLIIGTGLALATPLVRVASWPAALVTIAAAVWLSAVVLGTAWRRWNRAETALAMTRPGAVSSLRPTVVAIAGWALLTVVVEALGTIGVDLDVTGGALPLTASLGRVLPLAFAPLVIGLITTTDYRGYAAARRAQAP